MTYYAILATRVIFGCLSEYQAAQSSQVIETSPNLLLGIGPGGGLFSETAQG